MAKVILPIPDRDFDPTEVAVGWKVLAATGHEVIFATPSGDPGQPDELMVNGRGLDPWGFVPVLRAFPVVGRFMRADAEARRATAELAENAAFRSPRTWEQLAAADADALYLPGGHRARGMRCYLESTRLQSLVVDFFRAGKPVAAVCHGVLLAARSIDAATGVSVLHGRRTTGLTWQLERKGWSVARWTRFWDRDYFRTYVEAPGQANGYMSVQQEVTRALARPDDFLDVPAADPDFKLKTSGRARDSLNDARPAFVVTDGSYVSARWPGDVHTFATTFASMLPSAG